MRKFGIILFACVLSFMYTHAQEALYSSIFSLNDVKLLEGSFKHAQDLNVNVLLKYDVDRLLAPYLKVAGLPPKAENYPNWESQGLSGHIGGHYLSALAIHYASTGNNECLQRMEYMISELEKCQDSNVVKYPGWGAGYVGGVPDSKSLWPQIKAGNIDFMQDYWVPWYNVHKMFAGLRDAWLYAGSEKAKEMFIDFCDWAINITADLSDKQMEHMLDTEHGGMNEVLADAYQITGEEKYLDAAKRFSHKFLLKPMAAGNDMLDNLHANTQVPKAVGFQRIATLSGDTTYKKAARFFWKTVTNNRTLAFGGNSREEHFPPASEYRDFVNVVQGPESCNTYNMLKLTKELFKFDPQAKYADFYERALYNHILSTQHPEHGGYVYFTPARPRHYRVYSAPGEAMWCCVGTGMENHGKYGEFIYTHQQDSLFLNLFIASELTWREKGVKLRQETDFPYEDQTELTIAEGSGDFKLMVRYPSWVKDRELEILVNGEKQNINKKPSSYIAIDRQWKKGDRVKIQLPMHTRLEQLPNVPDYVAFMHGPVLLGAETGTQRLEGLIAGDGRWEHIAGGPKLPVHEAPIIVNDDSSQVVENLLLVKGESLNFTTSELSIVNNGSEELVLKPFYKIHDTRYMMYWMQLSESEYQEVLDSIAESEDENMELEERTVDYVQPGQQQPESDHFMESSNSYSGTHKDAFWRDAREGGYFSYLFSTNGEKNLTLRVKYWGNESGNRTFDILIDGEKLVTESISDKWNVSEFRYVEYEIPQKMVEGKDKIRVKFQAHEDGIAGGVFFVRLLRE